MPFNKYPQGINGSLIAYRDALVILEESPGQTPQLREDQIRLIRSVYGEKFRGQQIKEMGDSQIYCIAERIHSAAYETAENAGITSLKPRDISAVIKFRGWLRDAIRDECPPPNRTTILQLGRSLQRSSQLRNIIEGLLRERREHFPHEIPAPKQQPLY